MLEHGGGVRAAAARFGTPPEGWLDLSTGINPHPRLPGAISPACWNRLPETGDGLEEAARDYYGASTLLAAAGTQALLQVLPRLRPCGHVAVASPTYAEHAHAWGQAGHRVDEVARSELDRIVTTHDVVVVVNPNNPTGARYRPDHLLTWREPLAARGGWLVVDEAFMDATPKESLAPRTPLPGLLVLRSLGKFFGLAGARVGFLLAEAELLERVETLLGPWSVAGPSRQAAREALADRAWGADTRERLPVLAARLAALLTRQGLPPAGGTTLFQWSPTPTARAWWTALARRGVLVRCFDTPTGLRFGLPARESDWQRLDGALEEIAREEAGRIQPT